MEKEKKQCDHEWVGNGIVAQKKYVDRNAGTIRPYEAERIDDEVLSSIFCKKCGKIKIQGN